MENKECFLSLGIDLTECLEVRATRSHPRVTGGHIDTLIHEQVRLHVARQVDTCDGQEEVFFLQATLLDEVELILAFCRKVENAQQSEESATSEVSARVRTLESNVGPLAGLHPFVCGIPRLIVKHSLE